MSWRRGPTVHGVTNADPNQPPYPYGQSPYGSGSSDDYSAQGYPPQAYPTQGYPTGGGPQDYPQGYNPNMAYSPAPGYAVPTPFPTHFGLDQFGRPLSDKSKVVAGVLQLLLGGFGIGRFYIGDNSTAIWQIVVTFCTCGLGHLWGVIDGIMILVNGGTDAQGRILRD